MKGLGYRRLSDPVLTAFYPHGTFRFDHAGFAVDRSPWRAVQLAAWDALRGIQ